MLVVKGRQGVSVTLVVEVYRGKVWVVSVDQGCTMEAILEPAQADRFVELLARAATEARGGPKDKGSTTDTGTAP